MQPFVALAGLALSSSALATDVDTWQPGSSQAAGTGTPQGEVAQLGEGGSAGLLLGFAQDPVIREFDSGAVREAVPAIVPVVAYGGWTWDDHVRFDVFAPVYAHVQAPVTGFEGAALGDLRVQAVIPAASGHGWSFGVLPRFELPTGTRDALTRRGLSGGGALLLGGEAGTAGWLVNAGITGSKRDVFEGRALGSTLDAVTGAWWRPTDIFRAGAELDVHLGLTRDRFGANHTSTASVFAQQVVSGGWAFSVAAGGGLLDGVGAPSYRMLAGLTYGARPPDPDGDGLIGAADRCPNLPGAASADPPGCPVEARVVVDPEPEPALVVEAPRDTDLDGLLDPDDACPGEPRPPDERLEVSDGCPKGVYLTDFTIHHVDPVGFDGRTAELDPATTHVIDAVVGLLLSHPELVRVEVQAHVDDSGDAAGDTALAQARADAVVAYLLERTVEPERLETRSMGHDEPIDTNRTPTGRQRNQRIVFAILSIDRSKMAPSAASPLDHVIEARPESEPGRLTVVVEGGLEASVWVDHVRLERAAPFTDLPIAPGRRLIRVTNLRAGLDDVRTIDVVPGEIARVVVAAPPAPAPAPAPVIDVRQAEPGKRPPRSSDKR